MIKSYAMAILFASILVPMPGQAAEACWQVFFANGSVIKTAGIWQVRNKLSEQSFLMGKEGRSDSMINLARVASWSVVGARAGQDGKSRDRQLLVHMLDGTERTLGSAQPFFYRDKKQRIELPLSKVKAVEKCQATAAPAVAVTPLVARPETTQSSTRDDNWFTLRMRNGDVLNGHLVTQTIAWKAPYAAFNFAAEQIQSIKLGGEEGGPGHLRTRSGDDISGTLGNSMLAMTLGSGQTVDIDAKAMESLLAEKHE